MPLIIRDALKKTTSIDFLQAYFQDKILRRTLDIFTSELSRLKESIIFGFLVIVPVQIDYLVVSVTLISNGPFHSGKNVS